MGDQTIRAAIQLCEFSFPFFGWDDDPQAPIPRRRGFLDQAALCKVIQDAAEITFIDDNTLSDLFGGTIFGIADFIEYTPFRERERTVKEMLIQQPNNIGVKAIEASDPVNEFLVAFHGPIIAKILDFVKYFRFTKNEVDHACHRLLHSDVRWRGSLTDVVSHATSVTYSPQSIFFGSSHLKVE